MCSIPILYMLGKYRKDFHIYIYIYRERERERERVPLVTIMLLYSNKYNNYSLKDIHKSSIAWWLTFMIMNGRFVI